MLENPTKFNSELVPNITSIDEAKKYVRDIVRKHALARFLHRSDILKMSLTEFNEIINQERFNSRQIFLLRVEEKFVLQKVLTNGRAKIGDSAKMYLTQEMNNIKEEKMF
jgi:hypothetical protein